MVDVARVNLYGQPIGSVRWDQRYEVAQFEHDPDFVRQGIEPSPLMMPVREGRVYSFGELDKTTFKGLPGMLADSLPDTYDRALFEKWLALTGRTSGNAIETLCFLVKRCMGALEFEPAIDAVDTDIRIEVDSLVDSQRSPCRQIKFQREHQLRQKGCHCRNSAPRHLCRRATGQGNHCLQQSHRRDPFGTGRGFRRFDYYIIKLDGVSATAGFRGTENFGRLEYSFSRLVKECGIDMAECSLIEENGRAHFLTKRFDRIKGAKVHVQTLCGIAHFDYQLLRAYSYEQAFALMRGLRLTYKEAQEMFRRMVFNVVVRNQDDHTKNISFLMDRDGKWRLSPAYDMGYAYNPDGQWTSVHQMSINGKFSGITKDTCSNARPRTTSRTPHGSSTKFAKRHPDGQRSPGSVWCRKR